MNMNSKSFAFFLAIFLIAALTAVYWNHFDNGFHFDDSHTIVNNGFIKNIDNLPQFFQDSETTSSLPTNQAYRPVITSLNAIDYWIAGSLNPKVFHWHIYLEFLLLLGLLYLLLLRIFEKTDGQKHYLLAVIGASFFGFHTATAETINYIIARSDGFSTLMVLSAVLIYISNKGWSKEIALIPLIIGCLAKPTTLMLAPILFLYDFLLETPSFFVKDEKAKVIPKIRASLKGTLPFFLFGAAMYFFTRSMFSETWKPSDVNALEYLNTQPYIFWVYIKTFFYPTGLTADSDLALITDLVSGKVVFGLTVILITLFIAFKAALNRKTLPIAFGIFWFYVALIPSSSIVPLAEVMNHHRTFFPYIGLVIASVWAGYLAFDSITKGKPSVVSKMAVTLILSCFLGAHAHGTFQRNEVWDNDASLWKDVTIKSPNNGRGLMNYGLTEMRMGRMESAISFFERALKTSYGGHPYLYVNLGIAKNSLGIRTKNQTLIVEGEKHLKQAVQMGPGYPDCHYHYANWLQSNGHQDDAIKHLNLALELSPGHQQAKGLLDALTITLAKKLEQLEQETIRQNTPEAYLNLSLKYYNAEQYENCIKASYQSLELKPNYAEAYNNICSAYNKLGLYEEALKACNKALILKPDYALAKGNLNWSIQQLKNGQ